MSLGEPVQGGLQAGVKELRHSNVLADGVVLDANYALQASVMLLFGGGGTVGKNF
jgi:hypothetical protein